MCTTSTLRNAIAGATALCVLAAGAFADLPDVPFELTVISGGHTAVVPIHANQGLFETQPYYKHDDGRQGGGFHWMFELRSPLSVYDGGEMLARFDTLTIEMFEDPEVNLNFSVQAGASDTSFHLASSLLTFPEINNAVGTATAGIGIQDVDGTGATLTGIGDTGGAYLAQYNGWAGDPIHGPQGATFLEGIPSVAAAPWMQNNDSDTLGWTPIGAAVSSMSALVSFDLTAQDLASGTSHFEVVPEPAGLMLLALGALSIVRRR